jgi:hypothetical protein
MNFFNVRKTFSVGQMQGWYEACCDARSFGYGILDVTPPATPLATQYKQSRRHYDTGFQRKN